MDKWMDTWMVGEHEMPEVRREMLDQMIPGGVMGVRLESDFPFIYANPRMAYYLGYGSVKEFCERLNESFLTLVYEEDREYVQREMMHQLEEKEQYSLDFRVMTKSGECLWMHNVGRRLEEDPKMIVTVFYDIDEEKQRGKQQEKYLTHLQDVMDHVPGGICVFLWKEEDLRVVTLSREFCHMLGISEAEPIKDISANRLLRLHPDDRKWVQGRLLQAIKRNETLSLTARFYSKSQKDYIWLKFSGNIVQQEDGSKLCYISCMDITREKLLEEKLKASEYSLKVALEDCNIYSGKYDLRTNTTTVNRRIQEDFGMPEVLEQDNSRRMGIISREGREELLRIAQEIRSGSIDTGSIEVEMKKLDSEEWIWTRQTYTVVEKDENGMPLSVISTAQDITKQKQDERRFNEESVYHRMLLKNMTSVIRINISKWELLDYAGEYTINHRDEESPFETMAKHITDPRMRMEFEGRFRQENLIRCFHQGQSKVSYTYRSHRLTGVTLWVETSVDMICRSDGDIMGLVTIKDVDRQMLNDQVRGAVIDSLVDFVGYKNYDGEDSQVFSERSKYRILPVEGKSAIAELLNRIYDVTVPEERELLRENLDENIVLERIRDGQIYHYIYHVEDAEHEIRTKRIHFFKLKKEWNVVVVMQRDISDIVEEEKAKNTELQNALSIANRASQARDEFLSSMSHDLRTPLNGIIGASELAREVLNQNTEQVEEYLEDISTSGRFMLNLVNDILDMNRVERGKQQLHKEPLSFQKFAGDLQQMFEPLCKEKEINLVFDREVDNKIVYTDPVRLKRLFHNLLSNAVKFTPRGGTVAFYVMDQEMIGDTYFSTMVVSDSGTGMSEEFQKHMYEIFTQENNTVNAQNIGTGLGLSIAKSLVELMGGNIRCESTLGVGTKFIVTLPFKIAEQQELAGLSKTEKIDEEMLRDHKVLLVEDHALNAKIVRRLLENKKIQVEHVVNGKEAVEHFQQAKPFTYDAILMDISMPVMDGLEATRQIRALGRMDGRLVPVIALTANAFEADIQKSKAAGMNDHLTKPIDPQKLFQTLMHFWSY